MSIPECTGYCQDKTMPGKINERNKILLIGLLSFLKVNNCMLTGKSMETNIHERNSNCKVEMNIEEPVDSFIVVLIQW